MSTCSQKEFKFEGLSGLYNVILVLKSLTLGFSFSDDGKVLHDEYAEETDKSMNAFIARLDDLETKVREKSDERIAAISTNDTITEDVREKVFKKVYKEIFGFGFLEVNDNGQFFATEIFNQPEDDVAHSEV